MNKNIKLTLKTAKNLIKQEFGVSATGLTCVSNVDGVIMYELKQGNIVIRIENDWEHHDGMIHMIISYGRGSSLLNQIDRCFHPESLAVSAHATNRFIDDRRQEIVLEASREVDERAERWREDE